MKTITKEEIRKETIRLIRENGYHNVTITDICRECGITKPTFYKHAGSKEDVVVDYYDLIIEQILKDPVQLIYADSHYEQLVCIFSQLIRYNMQIGFDLSSQMIIANLNEDRGSFDMRDEMTKVCHAIIKKGQDKGCIRNNDSPEDLYQAIAFCFMGFETVWCIRKGKMAWERDFFDAMATILNVREDLRACHDKYIEGKGGEDAGKNHEKK